MDFTFIDDVTEGITKLVNKISLNEFDFFDNDFNLSTKVGTSVKDLAKIIKKIFNSNSKLSLINSRDVDVQNFIGEYAKAKSAFSYEPRTSLKEGLKKYKKRLEK